jgi:uncharacterized protein (UPF0335 family)
MDILLLQKIERHKQVSQQIESLEEEKKALGAEIMHTMTDSVLKVPGFVVKRLKRTLIKTSLEKARQLGAVKWQETVDKDKIKELIGLGTVVEDVNEIQYIQISETADRTS